MPETETPILCIVCDKPSAPFGPYIDPVGLCENCFRSHHEFSPSRLGRFALCPGSYLMGQDIEPEQSEEAAEGSKMHEAVWNPEVFHALSLEQQRVVLDAMEYARSVLRLECTLEEFPEKIRPFVEVPLTLRSYNGKLLTWGRADIAVQRRIIDFKFGFGELSEASIAIQMGCYGAGGVQESKSDDDYHVYVYQPRTRREWTRTISPESVQPIVHSLERIIEKAQDPAMDLRPSHEACVQCYCPAIKHCPAVRALIPALDKARVLGLTSLSTERVAALCSQAKPLKPLIEAVERELRDRLIGGDSHPDWYLQTRRGRRYISSAKEAYAKVCDTVKTEAFLRAVDVKISSLEEEFIAAYVSEHERATKTEARRKFEEALGSVLRRGDDSVALCKKGA